MSDDEIVYDIEWHIDENKTSSEESEEYDTENEDEYGRSIVKVTIAPDVMLPDSEGFLEVDDYDVQSDNVDHHVQNIEVYYHLMCSNEEKDKMRHYKFEMSSMYGIRDRSTWFSMEYMCQSECKVAIMRFLIEGEIILL